MRWKREHDAAGQRAAARHTVRHRDCVALGGFNVVEGDVYVPQAFVVEIGLELIALMLVVQRLDGLFEADGDE